MESTVKQGVITLTFYNQEINWTDPTPPIDGCTIVVEGTPIVITYTHTTAPAYKRKPDPVTVTPPEGWVADPPRVDVPEDGFATIIVYPEGLS